MSNSISSKSSTGKTKAAEEKTDSSKTTSQKEGTKTIRCSNCGKILTLERHPDKKGFLVAYDNCTGTGSKVMVFSAPISTVKKMKEVK